MNCTTCGKNNPEGSKFCQHCGLELNLKPEPSLNKNRKNKWESIAGVITFIGAWVIGKALGQAIGITFILLLISWFIGYGLASWFVKKHSKSTFFSIISWLNVISWLSPIFGFLTAGITYVFAKEKKKTKYTVLWMVAVVLSLINVVLYPYVTSSNTNTNSASPSTTQTSQMKSYDVTESVIDINCDNKEGGSGTIITESGLVLTNNHVIKKATTCFITLPEKNTGSIKAIYTAVPIIVPDISEQYDLAFVSINGAYTDKDGKTWGDFPINFPVFTPSSECEKYTPKLGDNVKIYGYPVTSGGYNLTVTDGIISSFDEYNDILTSAKIDNGNSGGLAVTNNNCFLGIPSAVVSGNYQNLGVIIPASVISEFAQKAESSYKSTKNETTANNNFDSSCLTLKNAKMYGNSYYAPNPTYIASLYNGCTKAVKNVSIKVNFYTANASTDDTPSDTEYVNLGISYLGAGDAHAINGTITTPFDTSGNFNWEAEIYSADKY